MSVCACILNASTNQGHSLSTSFSADFAIESEFAYEQSMTKDRYSI